MTFSDILSGISSDILSGVLSGISSDSQLSSGGEHCQTQLALEVRRGTLKDMQKICQTEWQNEGQKICQKDMPERMSEDMPDGMPE